jgi:hypothetical protein
MEYWNNGVKINISVLSPIIQIYFLLKLKFHEVKFYQAIPLPFMPPRLMP